MILGKIPFQTYTIEHGIDRRKVQVPLKHAAEFEGEIQKLIEQEAPMAKMLMVVSKYDGKERAK